MPDSKPMITLSLLSESDTMLKTNRLTPLLVIVNISCNIRQVKVAAMHSSRVVKAIGKIKST